MSMSICMCMCMFICVCKCVGQLWHKETYDALDKKGRRTKNLNTSKTKCNYNKDFSTAARGNEGLRTTMQFFCYLKMQQCCMGMCMGVWV